MDRDDTSTAGPLSPEQALAVIAEQQTAVARELDVDPALLYGAWGIAYTAGFGAVFGSARGALPGWAGGAVLAVLVAAAAVVTTRHSVRAARGVGGPSRLAGALYGWSWALAFAGLTAMNAGLARAGLTPDQMALLWPASALVLVGVLYLAGGALWRDRLQFGLGGWVLLTGAVSVFAGTPANALLLAVAGGGGFLAAAAWFAARRAGVGASA